MSEVLGKLVRPERFELPTYCSGGHTAREINGLAGLGLIWSGLHKPCIYRGSRHLCPRLTKLAQTSTGYKIGYIFW